MDIWPSTVVRVHNRFIVNEEEKKNKIKLFIRKNVRPNAAATVIG